MKHIIIAVLALMATGCATKGDIRYLENRITRGFNVSYERNLEHDERINSLAAEMDKQHPPKKTSSAK